MEYIFKPLMDFWISTLNTFLCSHMNLEISICTAGLRVHSVHVFFNTGFESDSINEHIIYCRITDIYVIYV